MSADTIQKNTGIKEIWARLVSLFEAGENNNQISEEEVSENINSYNESAELKEALKEVETMGEDTEKPINIVEKAPKTMSAKALKEMREKLSKTTGTRKKEKTEDGRELGDD